MFFYVFRMAVFISSLRGFAVEAIWISFILMILNLNGFCSIFPKQRNSHGHLKCIKKHKITQKSCCLSAIMLCSIHYELL